MAPVPPSVLRRAKVTSRQLHGGPKYQRTVNVPLPGWLHARVRAAAAHHGLSASAAFRCLAVGALHHPDAYALVAALPSLPVRGAHAPRVRVRLDPDLARRLHEFALRHGGWKAPLLGRLALVWTSTPGDGTDVAPEDVAEYVTG